MRGNKDNIAKYTYQAYQSIRYKHFTYWENYAIMSTGHKTGTHFLCGDGMKVTNTSITDNEIADVLSQAGLTDNQISTFLSDCCGKECCAEKVRTLRNARRTLLDSIHREQALLDKLDYVIWCTENRN